MLQIKDISKEYKTGTLIQKALNHVSLNLRDSEFVAILGPSGSGKTTLLNIIGGLDRYDSGDLVINGVSTKKYKDRDWDSYRNHTIGFVFQSYNLIPHQTILANVELALTIGGISRSERKKRATEALEKVGLGEQLHKKPSQMSGGQMQRVAIARALVNNPDILLADEPTGALDSETSIQVMDLLKEVANDRLVVMVTHNPELAEQYATRIVTLKDGVIRSDTDPFDVEENESVHKNFGKSSMSFLTALGLSFNNLKTKLARTLLIALAGSIGITGIALILSLSNGVNQYIKNVEEETLSEYPLEITSSSFDLTSFMGIQIESMKSDAEVTEWKTISNMLTKITSNDLSSLRLYLDSDDSNIGAYARAIEYSYGFTPEVYRVEGNTYYQVNPDSTFSDMGFSMMSMYSSSSTNSFMVLPEETSLYIDQYELKAGHWPENSHELVVVLTESGRIADLTLYALGMKDHEELENLVKSYVNGEVAEIDESIGEYHYSDFLGLTFKLLNSCDYYQYDSDYSVWTNKSEDRRFIRDLLNNGTDLTVVGVVMPKEDSTVSMLSSGVYYLPSLITECVSYAADSEIVKAQIANPNTDVISNTPFGEETDGSFDLQDLFSVDEDALANAIQFDTGALNMDMSGISLDNIDLSGISFSDIALPEIDLVEFVSQINITLDPSDIGSLLSDLYQDYTDTFASDPSSDITKLPSAFSEYLSTSEAKEIIANGISQIVVEISSTSITGTAIEDAVTAVVNGYMDYAAANGITDFSEFSNYLASDEGRQLVAQQTQIILSQIASTEIPQESINQISSDLVNGYAVYASGNNLPDIEKSKESFSNWVQSEPVQARIMETVKNAVDTDSLEKALDGLSSSIASSVAASMEKIIGKVMEQVVSEITYSITDAMSQMAGSLENALKIDTDAFARAFKVTMTEDELQELMAVMMTQTVTSYDGNMAKLGYYDLSKPTSITIYPRDFDSKSKVKDILNAYNQNMEDTEQEEKVVNYSDIVGTLMSSVTDIINAISYVLVAFVAISLVVSSIMIGVITYISVLERKKEIGILRAIGASKRNISEVFNAETFIIGLLAGIIGIASTELILIPGNILIHHLTEIDSISATLPPIAGIILIVLSVFLTLLGGLLPSKKAAKSDPVTALRTE